MDAEINEIEGFDMEDFGFLFDDEEEAEDKPVERDDLSEKVGETFEVVVECDSELHQEEIFYRLTGEGLRCRTLTL